MLIYHLESAAGAARRLHEQQLPNEGQLTTAVG
jgi:hypothetical protein